MKAVLIVLGGSVLAVTTFAGGLISATAMFTARNEPSHFASTDVSDLWTSEPVKIDTGARSLDRVAARPASPRPTAQASSALGGPTVAQARTAVSPFYDSGNSESGGAAVGDTQPGMAAEHLEWCASRYRSYRPRDNSYTPFSGGRRQCESPYAITQRGAGHTEGIQAISEAPSGEDAFEKASGGGPLKEQIVADLGPSTLSEEEHSQSCFNRYRSYRVADNTYQPVSGGPRRQCQ